MLGYDGPRIMIGGGHCDPVVIVMTRLRRWSVNTEWQHLAPKNLPEEKYKINIFDTPQKCIIVSDGLP